LELPAWFAASEQLPVPLVIVTVFPVIVHAPEGVIVTGSPEEAVAETLNVLLYTAVAGAPVRVTLWFALLTVSVVLVSVAGVRLLFPG